MQLGQEVAGLTYSESDPAGVNVFVEDMAQSPDLAVAVMSSGGFEADSLHGYDSPTPQVVVRAAQGGTQAALALWRVIYSHLHGLEHTTLPDGTLLVWCIATQSEPARMGPDDNGRQRFSLNLRCEVVNVSEHREWQGGPLS